MTNNKKKEQRFFMVEVTSDARMKKAREQVMEYCKKLKQNKKN